MRVTRRTFSRLIGFTAGALAAPSSIAQASSQITPGPYQGTRDSLRRYQIPAWFGELKFGIWSHWGPQSAVGAGDWYARNMYMQGSDQYRYHLQRFGPQSKIGYKDLIPLFTASQWDPDALIDLYVRAGAKYFFSMGVHHDNFDLWNSRYQPRWNSVAQGPKKDVVGLWAAAARRRGLRFGVSEHLSNSYDWFAPSHLSDLSGPYKGIPYDGTDSAYADLYHDYSGEPLRFARQAAPMGRVAPKRWKERYLLRIKDLIDQHKPDMLYTDGGIPFEGYGLSTVGELYNVSAASHSGHSEAVYYSKVESDCAGGTCVLDRERGVLDGIWSDPWQTDTCIGDWHYKKGIQYKSGKRVIDLLVDIVSKNGNLLLNFPLPADGELDSEERKVLDAITDWMSINSEGIYGSQPWKVYGEGPAIEIKAGAGMNESTRPDLTASDFRFTRKGGNLYVFVQGWPGSECIVKSLGAANELAPGKIAAVDLLGGQEHLSFRQEDSALRVNFRGTRPTASSIGITLRISFA